MLNRSPTWARWEQALHDRIRTMGVRRWRQFPEIKRNIRLSDKDHYIHYAKRCREIFWPDATPETIVEFGAGYGGMVEFWPAEVHIINLEIPPMIQVQEQYLVAERKLDLVEHGVSLLSIDDFRLIDWSDKHFFSAFSFTETTQEVWQIFMAEVFPRCRGAYITGSRGWNDGPNEWPWEELKGCFDEVVVCHDINLFRGVRREFCGTNNRQTP